MSIDNIIDISISLGAGALTRAGFGIPLIVASAANLGAGFTERNRSYASAADAAADPDLAAVISGRVAAIFSQEHSPATVKVGRREADVAQVDDYTVTGATDGNYSITINNLVHTFVASTSTVTLIVAGLVSAINDGVTVASYALSFNAAGTIVREDAGSFLTDGLSIGSEIAFTGTVGNNVTFTVASVTAKVITVEFGDVVTDEASVTPTTIIYAEKVTASDADPIVTVTAQNAGIPFDGSASSTGDPITEANTTPNSGLGSELSALLADDSDWFHFCLDTRSDTDILRATEFAEANKRMFWSQSSSADIITTATTDIFTELVSKSYRWVVPFYYSSDSVYGDCAWMGKFAAADFDQDAPTAAFLTLAGIATEQPGTTAQNNMIAKKVNFYTTLKGVGATSNSFTPAGYDVELVVTGAWVEARMSEDVAALFLSVSNSKSRIRFNDIGFQQIAAVAFAVLKNGERIGHFNDDISDLSVPERADVPAADVATGTLRITFGAQYSGRVKDAVINGTVAADFVSLAA